MRFLESIYGGPGRVSHSRKALQPDAIFARVERNFSGARIAAVTFMTRRLWRANHAAPTQEKEARPSACRLPMHRIGDTSIGLLGSCFSLPIGVPDCVYPLHLVRERLKA